MDRLRLQLEHSPNQSFHTTLPTNGNHLLSEDSYQQPQTQNKKTIVSSSPNLQSPSHSANQTTMIANDNQRESWYHHQCEESNLLIYSSNTNKLLENNQESYSSNNTRCNGVKGIRNDRTSFFEIPAATHPYYRFPSPPGVLKKEPNDGNNCLHSERLFSGPSSLNLGQQFHHHHHHHIQYPDSTTNQQHQTIVQTPTSSSPTENPAYAYHSGGYSIRPLDSSIVSSTEPDINLGNIYTNGNTIASNVINQRRGSLQLWQFLVALLDEPSASSGCIAWTGRGMEFKLIEPEEVARRWGLQKNRPAMNYDKLSRSLRYYYEKGIMQKVAGERYVYKFVCDPDALFNMAYGHGGGNVGGNNITDNNNFNINNCKNNNNNNNNNNTGLENSTIMNENNCPEKNSTSIYYSNNSFSK